MATHDQEKPIHRYRRLKDWDYSRGASLFVTLSTSPRRALFGRVANGVMCLSPLGCIEEEALAAIPRFNPGLSLFGHVVMPDHVHFNVHIQAGLAQPLAVFGNAIRRFKNCVRAEARRRASAARPSPLGSAALSGAARPSPPSDTAFWASEDGRAALGQIWQQGCHDRLCLSRAFIDSSERYIAYNVAKWELMHNRPETLRIHEPLDSPRLDAQEYWKGVGNLALLDTQRKLLSLRVSRKVAAPAAIAQVVERMECAVAQGYVIISGFISPGEKAVRDWLCANESACFIRMLPTRIPNTRAYKPESRYVSAFSSGRYLEIARGNEDVDFGRPACLDLNDEIVRIAKAGEGLAVYWLEDGPTKL